MLIYSIQEGWRSNPQKPTSSSFTPGKLTEHPVPEEKLTIILKFIPIFGPLFSVSCPVFCYPLVSHTEAPKLRMSKFSQVYLLLSFCSPLGHLSLKWLSLSLSPQQFTTLLLNAHFKLRRKALQVQH
jgi:hypothetical protein